MFFQITMKDAKSIDDLSYMIQKHPDSVYRKGKATKVTGFFISKENTNPSYLFYVEKDYESFIERLKKKNFPVYLNKEYNAITPENITSMKDIFRSAFNKKYPEEYVEKFDPNESHSWEIKIGPWAYTGKDLDISRNKIINWFKLIGCKNAFFQEDNNPLVKRPTTLVILDEAPLHVILKRVYQISFALNKNLNSLGYVGDSQKDSLVEMFNSIKSFIPEENLESVMGLLNSKIKDDRFEFDKNGEDFIRYAPAKEKRFSRIELSLTKFIKNNKDRQIKVLELGCGYAYLLTKLASSFPNVNFVGVDATDRNKEKTVKVPNMKLIKDNFVYPMDDELDTYVSSGIDVLICSEAIEHLNSNDRKVFRSLLKSYYKPNMLIVTVPCIEYNDYLNKNHGTNIKMFRHRDHKIEYTKDSWNEEFGLFSDLYNDVTFEELYQQEDAPPVSYFYLYEGIKNVVNTYQFLDEYDKSVLETLLSLRNKNKEESNKYIIKFGLTQSSFMRNNENIFFLGPDIAPVDSNGIDSFLEHPTSVFNYYRNKGYFPNRPLFAEKKYMGSRMHVLVMNDESKKVFGFEKNMVAISRTGNNILLNESVFESFKNQALINLGKLGANWAAFDCELLPWSFIGAGLIEREFQIPTDCLLGEANFLRTTIKDPHLLEELKILRNAEDAMNLSSSLKNFTGTEDPFARVFGVIGVNYRHNDDIRKMEEVLHKEKEYELIEDFCDGMIFKPVEWFKISNEEDAETVTRNWLWQTSSCGVEGYVIKTDTSNEYVNDKLILPYLKVRGKDYLRIIYGPRYLYNENLFMLKSRKISTKRSFSIKETIISKKIFESFISGNNSDRLYYTAMFIGSDCSPSVKKFIDATL